MASATSSQRWWHRRGPSILVFSAVVATMGLASVALWAAITDTVGTIGEDQQGVDPWEDPVGIELVGDFQVVRIPDCAVAPIVRIELWDEQSQPYWQVEGPPTPLASFAVGVTPEGFTEGTAYAEPPEGAVLRLVVVRKVKGVAGLRYTEDDVRADVVSAGDPLVRYKRENFITGSVCGDDEEEEESADDDAGGTGGSTLSDG